MSPSRTFLTEASDARGQRRRCAGRDRGIERGIQIAAGLGQHDLAQQIGPLLRDAKGDMPAARMAHQVDRLRVDLLDEGDGVGDMLRHPVVVADAVPMLGKEVPQADRDDAMLFRQRPEHRIPGAEIAERAVDADQRMAVRRLRDRPCRIR